MDPYDSDSSIEDGDFTETGILLGYASEEIVDDTISHLGGWPTWLDDATPPPGAFANCKACNCPMNLLLELHGDLPDDFPTDERRLYIFGCPRKPCVRKPGSVRALRATRKVEIEQEEEKKQTETVKEDKKEEIHAPKPDLGASLFGASSFTGNISANANPFSSQPTTTTTNNNNNNNNANPFAAPTPASGTKLRPETETLPQTFADKVRISHPDQQPQPKTNNLITPPEKDPKLSTTNNPWPAQSAFLPPYPHYYLDAEHEALSRPSTPTIPENVTIDTTPDDGKGGGAGGLKDTFESELDKAFLKFSTRLAHNPEQVLRYEFRGEPLLYSYADEVGKKLHPHPEQQNTGRVTTAPAADAADGAGAGVSKRLPLCQYCGAERAFELQLVPHTISLLEEGREKLGLDPKDDAGMEWGTVIVGVCSADCKPGDVGVTGWREEWAGVQWEELLK